MFDQRLALLPTPYGEAELRALQQQIPGLLAPGLLPSWGIGCDETDAVRVQVAIGPDATPDVVAQVEAAVAPAGTACT